MFSRQAPAIHNALLQGGLAPAMASQTQNLLGQCQAGLVHRGPISIDRSRPDMQLIDPVTARLRYPQVEELGEEEEKKEEEEPEETPTGDPPFPPGPFDPPVGLPPVVIVNNPPGNPPGPAVKAGDYVTVNGNTVGLKHKAFEDGRNCTFQDGSVRGVVYDTLDISNTLRGDQLANSHIELQWDEKQANATVLRYGIKNLRQYRVVTAVEFFPEGAPDGYGGMSGPGIRITYESIRAWPGDGGTTYSVIPMDKCEDDSSGTTPREATDAVSDP
jgi:hypothetical protein